MVLYSASDDHSRSSGRTSPWPKIEALKTSFPPRQEGGRTRSRWREREKAQESSSRQLFEFQVRRAFTDQRCRIPRSSSQYVRQEGHNLGGRPKVYHNHCRAYQQIRRSNVVTSPPKRKLPKTARRRDLQRFLFVSPQPALSAMVIVLAPWSTCRMYCRLWWTQRGGRSDSTRSLDPLLPFDARCGFGLALMRLAQTRYLNDTCKLRKKSQGTFHIDRDKASGGSSGQTKRAVR